MNPGFFEKIQPALAVERLDAYRQDQAEPQVALARYLWNMALCESLYSPLQMVEIALRNALQRSLESHFRSPHWYDLPACWHLLTTTQQSQIDEAAFDATNGVQTPFGHRWGGDVFSLSHSQIKSICQGQTLALDVMSEYVVFLKAEPENEKEDE
jgi:hypothetical protein